MNITNLPVLDRAQPGAVPSIGFYEAARRALAEARRVDEVKDIRDKAVALQAYALQAKDKELSRNATEIRLRAERRVGELMDEQRRTVGLATGTRGQLAGGLRLNPPAAAKPTLADAGIDKNLADRARKAAAMPPEKYEAKIERQLALAEKAASATGKAANSRSEFSGEIEWYTPAKYLDLARAVLGAFDLDPASSAAAQTTVRAESFFTIEDDGLAHDWQGRVWMNPPYKQPAVAKFVAKLVEHVRAGHVEQGVLLVNNAADTEWFQRAVGACAAICFTSGRIRFDSFDPLQEVNSPPVGQAFLYFGTNVGTFAKVFSTVGFVVTPWREDTA